MEFVFAYLDAGSGALILQLIVGGAAGVAAFVRYRWHRLTGRSKGQPEPESAAPAQTELDG